MAIEKLGQFLFSRHSWLAIKQLFFSSTDFLKGKYVHLSSTALFWEVKNFSREIVDILTTFKTS